LARAVSKLEGGAKSLSIGQIKEVQKCVLDVLGGRLAEGEIRGSDVLALVEKHAN